MMHPDIQKVTCQICKNFAWTPEQVPIRHGPLYHHPGCVYVRNAKPVTTVSDKQCALLVHMALKDLPPNTTYDDVLVWVRGKLAEVG